MNLFFEFPVHVFGYNWTASNGLAGQKLAAEIDRVIQLYRDMGRYCDYVILVTHSMGGLVARNACMQEGIKDKVLERCPYRPTVRWIPRSLLADERGV